VGKSTLFNRLIEARRAITIDVPGTTRDRIYGKMQVDGQDFELIDTGGLELLDSEDPIQKLIKIQVDMAVDEAGLIVFLVDGNEGVTPLDECTADYLRRTSRPVVLVANKVDDSSKKHLVHDFYPLGFGEPVWMSAIHGLNTNHLLDKILDHFGKQPIVEPSGEKITRLAIVGQPNVGKSSLLNAFLKTDRVMVSDTAGTTRDPVEVPFQIRGEKFLLIDTAGIRRVNQLKNHIDKIAVIYSEKVIERADIIIFMLDVTRKLSQQDKRIAGKVIDERKACILVINKWDTVEDKETFQTELDEQFTEELYFMRFCPRIYISALSGQRVPKLQDMVLELSHKTNLQVNTNHLNHLIKEAVTIHQPPSYKGRQLKIYYVSQLRDKQGIFIFHVNDTGLVHFSYYRYLENTIRDFYKFEGVPIRLVFKGKEQKDPKAGPKTGPKKALGKEGSEKTKKTPITRNSDGERVRAKNPRRIVNKTVRGKSGPKRK
jgi:GTP-binding protein